MPERGSGDRRTRFGQVLHRHRPGQVSQPPGLDRQPESAAHLHRIGGAGDSGIDQHPVVAHFHRRDCVGRFADAGVHDQRDVRVTGAQRPQRIGIIQPLPRTNRRTPRHQDRCNRPESAARRSPIVGGIGKHLKPRRFSCFRRLDQQKGMRLQGVIVADHFQFQPGRSRTLPAPFPRWSPLP
jgi:hypothetical protein